MCENTRTRYRITVTHVSTTYVHIYRTVHCVTGSTRVCTNGTGNDWHDCNVRDIGNGDTRYPRAKHPSLPPSLPPRAFEDVIRSIQIADCGNVATHYVKFNDSRPGPPRATGSQTSLSQATRVSSVQPLFVPNPLPNNSRAKCDTTTLFN